MSSVGVVMYTPRIKTVAIWGEGKNERRKSIERKLGQFVRANNSNVRGI